MTTNNQGSWANISTNKKPLVNYNSDSESASGRIKDDKRMFSNNHGACINKSTNKRPLVNYNSESESTSGRFKDDNRLSTNNTRNRYGKNIKQTMQHMLKFWDFSPFLLFFNLAKLLRPQLFFLLTSAKASSSFFLLRPKLFLLLTSYFGRTASAKALLSSYFGQTALAEA
ncbi:hypothetical protein PPACK8108_LOCUS15463 [Phakopsora pachyrhizi]|uniref:Uncharacterized protein n=1 Tax=Phakopsora pachyrhizi TaxID=170000 RepID=A0AAV0B5Y0_PHAPC|nr:hypothetical protein PPACK8108_LOCUS15463 [Phakopsora pachyrhizi]